MASEIVAEAEHCLVVVLDTVRARSTYVGGKETTPRMAQLASEGTSFDRAIAPAPWTLPSHASMYTGRYPTEHGATHQHKWLDDDYETLPEQLQAVGVRTGVFTANMFLTESFNMVRGFDEVSFIRGEDNRLFEDGLDPIKFLNERENDEGLARFAEIASAVLDGPVTKNAANAIYYKLQNAYRRHVSNLEPPSWDEQAVAAAQDFISETSASEDQFFGVVNLIGAHGPWEYDRERLEEVEVTPEEIAPLERWQSVAEHSEAQWPYAAGEVSFNETDRKILTTLYEAWVHRVDELAGRLMDHLEAEGIRDDTLVVMTADHGECIAREGLLGHELSVDEIVAQVPLVVQGPGVPKQTINTPVSLTDLYGTIRNAMGIADSEEHLFDDSSRSPGFIEMYPIDPETVSEQYQNVAREFGYRCALFTEDGWAERRDWTEETFGDEDTLTELNRIRDNLNPHEPSDRGGELTAEVEDRLQELGYRS